MKNKELINQVKDKVAEKYKAGLDHKNIPYFEHLMDHYFNHCLKMERIWHNHKPTKTKTSLFT